MIKRALFWLCCLSGFAAAQQSVTLTAPAPAPVSSVTAQASQSGLGQYCWFIVAVYPIGKASPSPPACINNVGGTVTVRWAAIPGATSYDVLRSTSFSLPNGPANIAVATGVAGTSQSDTLGALSSYTITTAPPATAALSLDNQSNSAPVVSLDKPLAIGTTCPTGTPAGSVCIDAISLTALVVSALPVASSANRGLIRVVSDGSTDGDCTIGGGTSQSLCISTGVTWAPLGGALGAAIGSPGFVTRDGTLSWNLPDASLGVPEDLLSANSTNVVLNKTIDGSVNTVTVRETNIVTADVTTGDASTSKHGWMPKGDGDSTHFWNGLNQLGTPPGGGDVSTTGNNVYSATAVNNAISAAHTMPFKTGTLAAIPPTCTQGEGYFVSNATAGQNLYLCTATDTWTQQLNSGSSIRSVKRIFTGASGGPLVAGTTVPTYAWCDTIATGGTAVSWDARVDTGTATFKVWYNTSSTADPTVSNSLNTAGVGVSTGTRVHSTAFTDFAGSTAPVLATNSNVCIQLSAVSGSPTQASFSLNYQ